MSSICTRQPIRTASLFLTTQIVEIKILKRIVRTLKTAEKNLFFRSNAMREDIINDTIDFSVISITQVLTGYSWEILRNIVKILVTLTILSYVLAAINVAYAQNNQEKSNRPAIITLNGMHLYETLGGLANIRNDKLFLDNYIANALAAATQYRACLRISECDILPIPFGGNLRDSASVREYIRIVRDYILAIRTGEPGRPIVIVAHSWGSVVAYQALSSISRAQMLNNNVALVVSLGSPLQSACADFFATRLDQIVNSDLPGRELLGKKLRKPAVVDRWLNYYNTTDFISGQLEGALADENYEATIPVLSRAKSILPRCSLVTFGTLRKDIIEAHSSYYTDGATLRSVIRNVNLAIRSAENTQISCSNTALTSRNYGSAINLFEKDGRFLAEARCLKSTTVEIVAGHNYPQQYTHRYGYYYNGQGWVRFGFAGTRNVGDWFVREVRAEIPIRDLQTSKDSTKDGNFFVFYTCWNLNWRNGEGTPNWKCGCQTAACASPYWQAVGFRFVQGGK